MMPFTYKDLCLDYILHRLGPRDQRERHTDTVFDNLQLRIGWTPSTNFTRVIQLSGLLKNKNAFTSR